MGRRSYMQRYYGRRTPSYSSIGFITFLWFGPFAWIPLLIMAGTIGTIPALTIYIGFYIAYYWFITSTEKSS